MRWARYFDERLETMPLAWIRRLEEERLAEQVTRCYEGMAFYRRKLGAAGVRPEQVVRLEDLPLIPPTTIGELRESQSRSPPLGELACADAIDIVRIEPGPEVATAYTEKDLRTAARVGACALWACGIRPDDVVLDRASDGLGAALETLGAAVVPAEGRPRGELLELAPRLGVTALLGTAADVVELADELRDVGVDRLLAPDALYGMRLVWSAFAGECEERDGLHFLGQGAVLLELVQPDGSDPVALEPGAEGEIVLTHLRREATPVLRLRTGDRATILGLDCPCGRTGFRFRLA